MGNCAQRQESQDDNLKQIHNESISRSQSTHPERNPSAGTRLRELMGQFKSDIKLDVSIQTKFPLPSKHSQITGYTI